jgi:lipopolysaccharide transport system ATP-binding protein
VTETIIRVENVSKKFLLRHEAGVARYKSLRETLAVGAKNFARRFGYRYNDPAFSRREEFWALRDVSFEVNRGDVVGIIGRNGAGKSTLLKILSRITEQTAGRIVIHGRIASLLEVGTGFHPELTGRENIFLNGAILGMARSEIIRKFDDIVAFAEVEKFVDTPVKHYSSGMYVRLAFSVAAHLEPEILIVDEVLAVGDSDFQKRCLGKMREVSSKDGRTVLFVSHNMGMVSSLCGKGLLLESGRVTTAGPVSTVLMAYQSRTGATSAEVDLSKTQLMGDDFVRPLECYVRSSNGMRGSEFSIDEPVVIGLRFRVLKDTPLGQSLTYPQVDLVSSRGELIFQAMAPNSSLHKWNTDEYEAECWIPANFLNNDIYSIDISMATCHHGVKVHFHLKSILCFHVVEDLEATMLSTRNGYSGSIAGVIRPALDWNIKQKCDATTYNAI